MTNSSKPVYPLNCPICGVQTNYINRITEKDGTTADWYTCQCGVIFQETFTPVDTCDDEYVKMYSDEGIKENILKAGKTYASVIEELTLGRFMLDVGFGIVPHNMNYFEKRGWVTWGIDKNSHTLAGGNIYNGDFMTYDFQPKINEKELKKVLGDSPMKKRNFNLIWMSHVLEHFAKPLKALQRSYDLLSEDGVLYISTPDIDFINKTGTAHYPHWKAKEHNVMWTERALRRELERLGFKVILLKRNYASRFISWYDIHCIAQKMYF